MVALSFFYARFPRVRTITIVLDPCVSLSIFFFIFYFGYENNCEDIKCFLALEIGMCVDGSRKRFQISLTNDDELG